MSSNTNTLFWVITGAVIVLAVFLLVNNGQNNSLNNINNKFDDLFNEQINNSIDIEDIPIIDENYNRLSNVPFYKTNTIDNNGINVYIGKFYANYSEQRLDIQFTLKNISNDYIYDKWVIINFIDSKTKQKIYEASWYYGSMYPGEVTNLFTNGPAVIPNGEWSYYIEMEMHS